jgi:hypothetical protein
MSNQETTQQLEEKLRIARLQDLANAISLLDRVEGK